LADLGYDPDMGALPLRRVIQAQVEDHLSDDLLSGKFKAGDQVMVDLVDDEITLTLSEHEPEDEPHEAVPAS
jgi:ATP-dependent Clp protease ATP-binding subunit ClpA